MSTTESTLAAKPEPKLEPTILPCSFRSVGRLSNESIRHLHTLHDGFARNVAHSLDLFLGSPIGVKMTGVKELAARELALSLAEGYLVPFTLMPLGSRVLAKLDTVLLSPLVDVLLGGSGEALEQARELTDIDEELIRSVTELIGVQMERSWKTCEVTVMPGGSLKPAMAAQIFANEERMILLQFEITLGATGGELCLLLPLAFTNALVRSETARRGAGENGGAHRLRERVLECTLVASAELQEGLITVGEMLSMRPGTVLNLRTPVQVPVQLGVGTFPLFEMTPVRRGGRKTAQLGRASHPAIDLRR